MMSLTSFRSSPIVRLGLGVAVPFVVLGAIASPTYPQTSGNPADSRALRVRSDIQEADSNTGIVTARGNVRINYPARNMQATATQAQYFSRERRIVLTGNAYVLQDNNSIRGEKITYLIDEGRFIAVPEANQQVESIYFVTDPEAPNASAGAPPATP
ncbi:LptA/OstA family protein [Oxynema aestuarii]|jgi:lipopolysaccharide export system protein LptA|uniref:OstA family protein n=1 Tax=Oxynema aestuarii AP17 TaxID=2064643 RepID=A0A6H1TZ10_9CYAN|nr:OstA family protein [Oxynema aestuarii AP17]RMH77959.1 MAG: OstA family protein [Cyanobacteria bacterium J007]